jgi:hypothetical protein
MSFLSSYSTLLSLLSCPHASEYMYNSVTVLSIHDSEQPLASTARFSRSSNDLFVLLRLPDYRDVSCWPHTSHDLPRTSNEEWRAEANGCNPG